MLWALAALTMIVGNVMAVIQDNVKRMLAYSSIAHAGYLLIGFVAGTEQAYCRHAVFYLIVYTFMNLGAFASSWRWPTAARTASGSVTSRAGASRAPGWLR